MLSMTLLYDVVRRTRIECGGYNTGRPGGV